MSTTYQLAQFNVGRMLYTLDDPRMEGFTSNLEKVNALADVAPGFVWRLAGENDDATDINPYADDKMLINMSVWEDLDSLFEFTYHSDHVKVFADRRQWFEKHTRDTPAMVLWWVPAGHEPDAAEGKARLDALIEKGAHAEAFTWKDRFPAPA